MKNKFLSLSLILTATALLMFSSCRKTDDTDDSVSAEDHSSVNSTLNASMDDAANVAGGVSAMSGKTEGGIFNLCGATVDTSQKANGIITITYTGTGCFSALSRTGTVTVTLENYANGTRWKDMGAVLDVAVTNLKVTNTITGGYFTLNGTHQITNVTGGLAWQVMDGQIAGPVTHRHTTPNGFALTWADGTQRTWNVNRLRTFTNTGGVKTVTLSSDHTEGGVSNADAWGTNRNGVAFVSAILTPISSNNTCGWYKPTQGLFYHHVGGRTVEVLFGVDASGNSITSGCAYGFKITYTKQNRTKTRIVSYWF